MPRLVWDATGKHLYETGVDHGVLFPMAADGESYTAGVAWNGLTGVTESPSGGEPSPIYADNIKYLNLYSADEFGATIEAYTYPDEFAECQGEAQVAAGVTIGGQKRKNFGFSYRTIVGNDTKANDYGYKIHIIYNATAAAPEKAYATVNDSPEAMTLSWTVTTTPVEVGGNYRPLSHIIIDSTKVDAGKLASLEDALYGAASGSSHLPTPAQVIAMFA